MKDLTQAIQNIGNDISTLQKKFEESVNATKSKIETLEKIIVNCSTDIDDIQKEITSVRDRYEKAVSTDFPEEKKRVTSSLSFCTTFGIDSSELDSYRNSVDMAEKRFINDSESKLKELNDKLTTKKRQIEDNNREINHLNDSLTALEKNYENKKRLLQSEIEKIRSFLRTIDLDTVVHEEEPTNEIRESIRQLEADSSTTRVNVTDMMNNSVSPMNLEGFEKNEKIEKKEPTIKEDIEKIIEKTPTDIIEEKAQPILPNDDSFKDMFDKEEKKVICPECSAVIPAGSKKCTVCGAKIIEEEETVSKTLSEEMAKQAEETDKQERNDKVNEYHGLGNLNIDDGLVNEIITSVTPEKFNALVSELNNEGIELNDLGNRVTRLTDKSSEDIKDLFTALEKAGKKNKTVLRDQADLLIGANAQLVSDNNEYLRSLGKTDEEITTLLLVTVDLKEKIEMINSIENVSVDSVIHEHPYLFTVMNANDFGETVLGINSKGAMKP